MLTFTDYAVGTSVLLGLIIIVGYTAWHFDQKQNQNQFINELKSPLLPDYPNDEESLVNNGGNHQVDESKMEENSQHVELEISVKDSDGFDYKELTHLSQSSQGPNIQQEIELTQEQLNDLILEKANEDDMIEEENQKIYNALNQIFKPKPEPIKEDKPKPEPIIEDKPKPEPIIEVKPKPEPIIEVKPKPVSLIVVDKVVDNLPDTCVLDRNQIVEEEKNEPYGIQQSVNIGIRNEINPDNKLEDSGLRLMPAMSMVGPKREHNKDCVCPTCTAKVNRRLKSDTKEPSQKVIISNKWDFIKEDLLHKPCQEFPYNKLSVNLIGEILKFLDMREAFKQGWVNKHTLNAYYRYTQQLPFLLLELNKKARAENQHIADAQNQQDKWYVCYHDHDENNKKNKVHNKMTFSNEKEAQAKYSSIVEYGGYKISKVLYQDDRVVESEGEDGRSHKCLSNTNIYTYYSDGYYQFQRKNTEGNKTMIYEMYCTDLNYKACNVIELHQLKLKDELVDSVWQLFDINSNDSNDDNKRIRYTIQFGDGTATRIDEDGGDVGNYDIMFDDDVVTLKNKSADSTNYTLVKGCFGHSYFNVYIGMVSGNRGKERYQMFLINAPKFKRFGYQQPKSYIDVGKNNYTIMTNQISKSCFGNPTLKTEFFKVRVIIARLKSGKYKENIDCTDFKFSKTKFYEEVQSRNSQNNTEIEGRMILQNQNNSSNWLFYDKVLYAHAFNSDLNSNSQARVNLQKTPFILDKEKQGFVSFGQMSKGGEMVQKEAENSNQCIDIMGRGYPGGFGPANDDDKLTQQGSCSFDWYSETTILLKIKLLEFQ